MAPSNTESTKAAIILDKPSDWHTWLTTIRMKSKEENLWKYANPDTPIEELPRVIEPHKPTIHDVKPDAAAYSDLTADQKFDYKWLYDTYTSELETYRRINNGLARMESLIISTIATRHIYLIDNCQSPYECLKALQRMLAPSEDYRRLDISAQYAALKVAPKAISKHEQWMADWARIVDVATTLGLPEVQGTRAQEDFIIACMDFYPEYSAHCQQQIYAAETPEQKAALPSVKQLAAQFTRVMTTKKQRQEHASAHATLGAAEEGKSQKQNQQRSQGKKTCICGGQHLFEDCFYLNPSKRPTNWKENTETRAKINSALEKNPRMKYKVSMLSKGAANDSKKSSGGENTSASSAPPSAPNTQSLGSFATQYGYPYPSDSSDSGLDSVSSPMRSLTPNSSLSEPPSEWLSETPRESPSYVSMGSSTPAQSLLDRIILDPGSNCHVINNEDWIGWKRESNNPAGHTIRAGQHVTRIDAFGSLEVVVDSPNGAATITLTNVAYVKGFLTSIMGLARCRPQGVHFDSGRNILYKGSPQNVLLNLEYNGGHWLVDSNPERRPKSYQTYAAAARSREPKTVTMDKQLAHATWGHPADEAVNALPRNTTGLSLTESNSGNSERPCDTCLKSKATHIISRRPSEDQATEAFYRISIDILYILEMSDECWNGDRYAFHAIDEFTKWHDIHTTPTKGKPALIRWLRGLIARIERQFGRTVKVIHLDGERGFGYSLDDFAREEGIRIERTPKATHEPNGLIERANGVITTRARALRIHGNLPKGLSNELFYSAAYILNRTPTKGLNWRTPYELVWGRKPSGAHMRPIGSRAYAYNSSLKKADKTEARALVGHLMGYHGTNVFRIWLPSTRDILITRDVVLDPYRFYEDSEELIPEDELREYVEPLYEPTMTDSADYNRDNLFNVPQKDSAEKTAQQSSSREGYPTPDPSHLGGETSPIHEDSSVQDTSDDAPNPTPDSPDSPPAATSAAAPPEIPEGYRPIGQRAPKDIQGDVTESNIITGSRTRRPKQQFDSPAAFAVKYGTEQTLEYLRAFTAELSTPPSSEVAKDVPRIHVSQLPPEPKSFKQLRTHIFGPHFIKASHREWRSLMEKGVFDEKLHSLSDTYGAEILPLMWVYTYKLDADNFLSSFKARLVIRGDLQESPEDNTYAATLAIRAFRALVAIATHFGLEMKQYDVPTAFLNASLRRRLYAYIPEGIEIQQDIHDAILLVLRALYGLREAPALWAAHFKNSLKKLGLKPAPGFPGLYTNGWAIVFAYVDDVVIAFHRNNQALFRELEQQLFDMYNLKPMGDLQWFLGIRVIRDREQQKTWLSQDAFIEKVCNRFGIEINTQKPPPIPISENWLEPSEEPVNTQRTKLYQQLTGSLAYIAVWGRPDVARAHVIFASHLVNPGQSHLTKLHKTWGYLSSTRYLALEASASSSKPELFFGASDASFADEPATRKSSQGYLFKLAGMCIDWKSTVQRTVTKSTTEAELLALSLAGSQMAEWIRFFEAIQLSLDSSPVIYCDNEQTVRLTTKDTERLQTKVKHVDIHQLWIRQEVEAQRLNIKWIPTARMPADGLTKALPRQRFIEFVKQLNLVNIRPHIQRSIQTPDDYPDVRFPNRY